MSTDSIPQRPLAVRSNFRQIAASSVACGRLSSLERLIRSIDTLYEGETDRVPQFLLERVLLDMEELHGLYQREHDQLLALCPPSLQEAIHAD